MRIEMKFEVVVIPVADIDRSKKFYSARTHIEGTA